MNDCKIENCLTKRRKFTKDERTSVLMKTDFRCGHCGKKMDIWEATIDHIVPIDKGGLNDEFNLVGLCYECNEDKSNFLYDVIDYYPYILDKYMRIYSDYHTFAAYNLCNKSLFGYNSHKYMIYPDKQKDIIMNMIKRGNTKKKTMAAFNKLGVTLFITRAYTGDTDEIMSLITYCENNKHIISGKTYYKNEYVLLNDIRGGEVYVLRSKSNNKICGAFMFKKINDESFPFFQLRNIIESTNLHAKYIMTGAYINHFAHEAFDDIMNDIMREMIKMSSIPIYFDILNNSFADSKSCIIMPHEMDGVNGHVEFMTLKCIRSIFREDMESYAKRYETKLTEGELDLVTDTYINCKEHSHIDKDDAEIKSLFEKHPCFKDIFKPEEHQLYGIGFSKGEGTLSYLRNYIPDYKYS